MRRESKNIKSAVRYSTATVAVAIAVQGWMLWGLTENNVGLTALMFVPTIVVAAFSNLAGRNSVWLKV